MNSNLTKQLAQSYKQFDQDHDQLRDRLLDSLPKASWLSSNTHRHQSTGRNLRFAIRVAVSAAAVFIVLFSVLHFIQPDAVNPKLAWAAAVENANEVQTAHFILSTPSGNKDSSVEMWWQQPGSFRMKFDNGTVFTGNQDIRCNYNPKNNILRINKAAGFGPEMMFLGYLGKLFIGDFSLPDDSPLPGDNINQSRLISSEKVIYKGESCLKILSQENDYRYEYIIDRNDPIIYEVKQFSLSDKILAHMIVLDVDRPMDQSLFAIEPNGKILKDQRLK